MSREIMQQCLDLITALDKAGVVCELGLILELRNALGIPDKLKMKAELAKPEHPLDKKADNARELGLDYEPDMSTKQQNVNTSEKRVQKSDKFIHERKYPDHETYCGRCGACTYKPWVGLTDEEIHDFDKKLRDNGDYCSLHFARGVSAELKEKNG